MKRSVVVLSLFLLLATTLVGQAVSFAQINGVVQDTTGLPVPGAQVRATQTETGASRTTESGADGAYQLPSLPIGPYRLEVSKNGFATFVQTGIVLEVASNPNVQVALKVGSVSEQVQVEAAAAMVETQSTGVGQVVDAQRVVELPLNGRQATELIFLAGAAVTTPPADLNSAKNYPNPALVSVAGGLANGMTYVLDGGTHNDPFNNLNLPLPFPDALQEFKVETSALPAQYGHHSAAAVNAVTKSGTNQFHGDAFEFVRSYKFNARNTFATARDSLKRNQYGGTVGGPIIQNKLFFFAGYQGTVQRSNPSNSVANIPTDAMLAGDFTGYASAQCNGGIARTLRAPFVNNKISPALMSAPAVKLASYFPKPPDQVCGQITFGPLTNQDEQFGLYKLDWQLSSNHTILFRHIVTHILLPSPYNNNNPLTLTLSGADDMANSAVFGDTYVLGPRTVNSFRATFNRVSVEKFQVPIQTPADLGIKITPNIPNHVRVAAGTFQNISVFGYPSKVPTTSYQFSNDISHIKGQHQLGFGVNYIRNIQNQYNLLDSSGSFTFSANQTGLTMGDYFTGQVTTFAQANIGQDHARTRYVGLYGQDSWRVTPRLTVSMGVRWEPFFGSKRLRNEVLHFDQGRFDQKIRSSVYTNAPAGLMFPGDQGFLSGDKTNLNSLKNFAPRFGLVWDPKGDGKTSIRASWGMFYDLPHTLFFYAYSVAPPWGNRVSLTNPVGGFADPWRDFPGGDPFPTKLTKDFRFPASGAYVTNDFHLRTTYLNQWNFSIQRQVAKDWLVSANYLGNNMIHLWTNTDINAAVFGPGATTANTQARRRLTLANPVDGPLYSNIYQLDDGGTGVYHGMLLSVQRRLSQGFTVSANYTLSHCISDLATSEFRNTPYQNPKDRRYDRSNCAGTDRRHIFNSSAVISPPKFSNAFMQKVLGDWRWSTIFRAQSGPYMSLLSGVDAALNGLGSQRMNLVTANPVEDNPTQDRYFKVNAFQTPANGTFGNLGANNILGRGQFNFDMNLTRLFPITERQRLEFRWEAFQLLNKPILGQPNTTFNNVNFSKTTTASGERIMQFALKYYF